MTAVSRILVFLAASLSFWDAGAASPSLPPADQVLKRLLARSASVAEASCTNSWSYDKRAVQEELDSDQKVVKTTEKLYRVQLIRGVPLAKLVKVEGRELSADEARKEDERQERFRKRLSGRDPKAVSEGKEVLVGEELVNRFKFQVQNRESIAGRATLAVAFSSLPGQEEKTVQDRILNRLAGTLWVDEETAEVAALDVRLTKGFSLGVLGILGSVKDCQFKLSRKVMPDGAWVPETTDVRLSARMLVSGVHFHLKEESGNFQLEPIQ